MAVSKVKFTCGCGKSWDNPLEPIVHVDETGHTVNVNGRIIPDKPQAKQTTPAQS